MLPGEAQVPASSFSLEIGTSRRQRALAVVDLDAIEAAVIESFSGGDPPLTVTPDQTTLEDLGDSRVRVTIVQAEGGPTAEDITAAAEQPAFLTRMAAELGVAEVSFDLPPATIAAACAGVGGYGRVTHSDGLMYDCYEAPAAATDGPFASSVVDNMYLLWVFPARLAELATAAGSTSTLLGSVGIHTNLSEIVHYTNLSSKLDGMIRRDGGSFVETGCRFGKYRDPGATVKQEDGSIVTPNSDYKCTDNDQQGCTNKETLWLQWLWYAPDAGDGEEPFSYAPDAGVAILASVQNPVAIRPDSKWTFAADSPAGSTLYRAG